MGEIWQSLQILGKEKIRVKALLDSGASTTYINVKLAKKLGYTFLGKEKIKLADGRFIIGQRCAIILLVKGKQKPVLATAIDMPEKLILGHDFFQDNDIILDFSKDKFKFSKKIPSINRRLRL